MKKLLITLTIVFLAIPAFAEIDVITSLIASGAFNADENDHKNDAVIHANCDETHCGNITFDKPEGKMFKEKDTNLMPFSDDDAIRAIVGEAENQGYEGMLAVACAIRNRGTLKGVYGQKSHRLDVAPHWVFEDAARAWKESATEDITNGATMWENIVEFGKPSWYNNVVETYRYKDHIFFKEKKNAKK